MGRFTLLLALAFMPAVEAAEQERCSSLPTSAERIVCYDRQFPPDYTAPTLVVAPEPTAHAPAQPPPSQSESEPPAALVASPEDAVRETSSLGLVAKPQRNREESSFIKAVHRRDHQSMVFLLANEQIWLQDSERGLPFHVGDAVTIKSGTFGGYFLTSEDGTKTRVRRIK